MKNSIGVVIPAYNPNLKALEGYVKDLDKVLCPDIILIEIDDPSELVLSQIEGISANVEVSDRRGGKGTGVTDRRGGKRTEETDRRGGSMLQ